MQKYRFKIFLLVLVAATIYAACRKTDSYGEKPLSANQHSRFFEANRSSDPFEKALVNFIRKEYNGSSNLDKVIKQIGYPRWNKAITLNKQAQVFLETEDSSSITYIPFVRDSQNFVNASLVVNINSEDTTFGFFCDWQYAGLERGSATTDSTAEHYALFFMAFDKQVFGHKEFKVTDNTLFADHPLGAGEEYRKIHFRPQAGNPLIETNSAVVCFDLIVCGSPTNSHCTGPNGCDFANCYSPGTCYTIEVCFGVVGDGSSEGPLGNDLPPTGGGSGGGGNGGPPTPSECPQGPVTRGTVFTDIDFICGPGWVPVPIGDDPPYNPNVFDTIGVTQVLIDSFPCISIFLQDTLPNINGFTQRVLHNVFGINANVNIEFDIDYTLTKDSLDAYTQSLIYFRDTVNNRFYFSSRVYLNPWVLKHSSFEYNAAVFIHEPLHAFIGNLYYQYYTGFIDSGYIMNAFPIYWDFFTNPLTFPGSTLPVTSSHNIMASSFVDSMSNVIKQIYRNPNASTQLKDSVSKALAWGGLENTNVYANKPMSEKCRIASVNLAARDTSLTINTLTGPGLNCGAFPNSNYSSFKLSPSCQ